MSFKKWEEFKIANVITTANTGLDAIKRAPIVNEDTGIKCLRIQDISQKKEFTDWGFCSVNEKNYQNFKLLKNDIIVARTGETVGVNQIISKDLKAVFNNGLIRLRVDEKKIKSKFLYYNLQNSNFKHHIDSVARGSSTQPNLRIEALLDYKINIPQVEIQEHIVSILSSLDDKIELNRQTNQTLEAIAQAIFKEWFIAFNFPGATGEMKESEMGKIPKGWKVGKLGDLCDLAYGKALKAENRVTGDFPVVGSSGIVGFHNEFLVEAPGIVIGRKGTIGEVTWLHKNFYPIDTTYYIVDRLGSKSLLYHYFLLKEQDFKKIATDSAVPGLNRSQALHNPIILPEINLINHFSQIITPLFTTINNNEEQTKTLTQLRDSLLPKLMRGELKL